MKRLVVALLSGGVSSEAPVSAMSGDMVFRALDPEKYEVLRFDPKTDLVRLVAEAPRIDVALVILHGPYGEDGRIQGFLDSLGIPYQGTGVLGSALAMNKLTSKILYEKNGLATPAYAVAERGEKPGAETLASLGFPLVVKPVSGGSSIGMSLVKTEAELGKALEEAFAEDASVMLEAYVRGVELTGAVLGNDKLTALPIVEIVPGESHAFFDYEAKYTQGATTEICPARISEEDTRRAMEAALAAHKALFCRGYSRTDMILPPGGGIQILETNTIPGMAPTSLLPQAAEKAGLPFPALLDRLIALALEDARKSAKAGA